MRSEVERQVERELRRAATQQELDEVSRIIGEAKGRLQLDVEYRGFWEGKFACWEMVSCPSHIMKQCPAPSYRSVPCWKIEGTYAKLSEDGTSGDNTAVCQCCRVYRRWSHGEPVQLSLLGRGINVPALVSRLSSRDGEERGGARHKLVEIGKPAAAALVEALGDRDKQVRWEAAKALVAIRDPNAVNALVNVLEDEVFEIRWLAAEALIAMPSEAVVPLLRAVTRRSESQWLRQGAHHVLHDVCDSRTSNLLEPVLDALESLDAPILAPMAARDALDVLAEQKERQTHSCGKAVPR